MNVCRACGEDFGGIAAFDAHRVGKHAYTFAEGLRMEPAREDGRRCLHPEEMEARGFQRNPRAVGARLPMSQTALEAQQFPLEALERITPYPRLGGRTNPT